MAVSDFTSLFQSAGQQYGVDPSLLEAMASVESEGDPRATGTPTKYGIAHGLMQLLPSTAKALGVTNPNDPNQAIPAAAKLMAQNIQRYGDPATAVLAYHGGTNQTNWGPKTQAYKDKVLSRYQALGGKVDNGVSDEQLLSALTGGAPVTPGGNSPSTFSDDALLHALTAGADKPSSTKLKTPTNAMPHGLLDQVVQGASFGLGDEIGAAGGAVGGSIADLLRGRVPDVAQNYQNALTDIRSGNAQYQQENPVKAGLGQFVGGLASLGPTAAAKLAQAPSLLQKIGTGLKQGAASGALYGFGSGEGGLDSRLQSAQKGALIGAATGGAIPVLGAVASPVRNALIGTQHLDPEVAQLADTAVNKFGIPLRASQISESPFLNYLDSQLSKLPLNTLVGKNQEAHQAFTKAVAATMGEDASKLTPEVMQAAKTRIGGVFNNVAEKTPIAADDTLINDLANVESSAKEIGLDAGQVNAIQAQINKIQDYAAQNGGVIPGKVYQTLTGKNSSLSRMMSGGQGAARDIAGDIRDALDSALERSAAPEDIAALRTARLQYKNMKTVEDLAEKAGPSGQISPALLLNQVRKSYKNYAYTGAGDIGELGQIGQQFLKQPPSSGTAERLTVLKLLAGTGGLAGLGAYNPGAAAVGLGSAASLVGGGNVLGRVLGSESLRNHLIDHALNRVNVNPMAGKFLPRGVIAPLALHSNALLQQ